MKVLLMIYQYSHLDCPNNSPKILSLKAFLQMQYGHQKFSASRNSGLSLCTNIPIPFLRLQQYMCRALYHAYYSGL
jgi:hypothetical protein